MSTLSSVELGVLGPLQVRQFGLPVAIPGAKPRAILTMLGLYGGAVVPGDTLVELLWGTDPPRTAAKALQTHISALRRALGDGFVLTQGAGWTLSTAEIDAIRYTTVAGLGREARAAGDAHQAVAHFDEALKLWRGVPELPDSRRGGAERTRWVEGHAALVEDRADALLATGRAAELIGELEAAIADSPLRERRWGQLMLALYRAGRQGEALAAYQRVRALLADELGVEPGPDLRRLDSKIVTQDASLELPVSQPFSSVMRAVTFLLTDIEGSTAAWEVDADAMGEALARHDEIVEQVVTFGGGRLIKTRGEGDATFSVFDRPSAAAAAAVELQEAIRREPWTLAGPMRIRIALHTGEVEFRDGDYFGRAVNRAARLRSLANGGQTLCSGATAELVIDSLADDVVLADLGMRQLKNLARPEHVFELRLERGGDASPYVDDAPLDRPAMPAVLTGPGPFVGRGSELEELLAVWQATLTAGAHAVLIAGEPGVGKTRLAGEWARQAYGQGAVVVYGRCDEDLGAPYQPFAEALRTLVPCLGTDWLRGLRGVESLLPLVPALTDALPDLAAAPRAAPDAERYALFDAVVALLGVASASTPIVLVLDDLHWAAKPTLLLLRHLLRFGEQARVQIVGTYRSTDLDRSHPLAAMLTDLHRDGSATRLALGGLDEDDVTTYVAEAGYSDEELARALASVTGGNPFFLIEALRHVDESGGLWDPNSLPQGVREAVSRRLSRLPVESNTALAAAAVVGSRFAVDLVERVVDRDLVDAFDEASKAGIVIEEPGGRYRFNHALVRQSLLAELPSVRRMRLHQKIAAALESESGGADDERLAELAYHYFECAWAGNAAKAVEYCRRAADQAMARLGYEGAAELYDKALHALEELDDELPDREDLQAELLVARCEALLAAGDVVSATGAVAQLRSAAGNSPRLAAWGTCFEGQLSMLTDPERLDDMESAVGAAAETLAGLQDAAGEAKAHTVRSGCLARLGRIGDCEIALDQALNAARRAHEHRRVNAVLAGAPLAALWGPNPVPRAGGRCLDVVRLLRITTGSPVVEATSTRCQGVLDALRGRAAAGRQLIDSARRTLNELGMRHAALEVEQFAGIVELVADDAAAAEQHLRKAYNGFRRMGLDADTAETAALLARACLALDRDAEADEFCAESERLAGHAFKAAISWRSVRAQLLARDGDHDAARRVAEEAVAIAERTDALVDHGDACLALASVLAVAGDAVGARAAAERAIGLYELKGAAALAEKARSLLGERPVSAGSAQTETATAQPENACFRAGRRMVDAVERQAWAEVEHLLAPEIDFESRRLIVGVAPLKRSFDQWRQEMSRYIDLGLTRYPQTLVAARGERLALVRLSTRTDDASLGAPQDEFLQLTGLDDEGRILLQMWFDIEDLDVALAELDSLYATFEAEGPRPPLENAASRVDARFNVLFAERRWDEIPLVLADITRIEDRRAGLRREVYYDRADEPAEIRAIADLGVHTMTSVVVAIRGDRLALTRTRYAGRDSRPDAYHTEILKITELDAEERCVALIAFDIEDLNEAIVELDSRYLAGEAAQYAGTWSIVTQAYAGMTRGELPKTTSDLVNVDHRHVAPMAPDDGIAYLRASWDLAPEFNLCVEAVHRLSDLGAVFTRSSKGTSRDGFDAEWRAIDLVTVDGDLISRGEIFDESDLEAALARFDELSHSASRLENAASRTYERWLQTYAARDWAAMSQVMADAIVHHDRRRAANGGTQEGREAVTANMRAIADVGVKNIELDVVATRGDRLALGRQRVSGDMHPDAFGIDVLIVIEVDADNRFAFGVAFDPDDADAAFEELESRYLAGDAAPYAQTWSIMVGNIDAFNARELPAWTPGKSNVDHRKFALNAPGEMPAFLRSTWDQTPNVRIRVEAVHRLGAHGAVVATVSAGSSHQGFAGEWRVVTVSTVEGDRVGHSEQFDEDDLDAALAHFDALSQPRPKPANEISRLVERAYSYFVTHAWDSMQGILAEDSVMDDRRRGVNAGVVRGATDQIQNMRVSADVGVANVTSVVVATRGDRLVLTRVCYSGGDEERAREFVGDALQVFESTADGRLGTVILFDVDDLDAAFEELDARYLAGEAAPYAHTWSVICRNFAAVNRHQPPETTPDWVTIDHRRTTSVSSDDLPEFIRSFWDDIPDAIVRIEQVYSIGESGAVVTQVAKGTSRQGFEAEWRQLNLTILDGDLVSRLELFAEEDLDAALARFDELSRPVPRLQNAASRIFERYNAFFVARDWHGIAEMVVDDIYVDDRRRVVSGGVQRGRAAQTASMRAAADVGVNNAESWVVATRGDRLALMRTRVSGDQRQDAFGLEMLTVFEIDADDRGLAGVLFDLADMDATYAELDARYMAGEAAAHAHAWSVVTQMYDALNSRVLPAAKPDWVTVDHQRGRVFTFTAGEITTNIQDSWAQLRTGSIRIEAVHRLGVLGAVVTHIAHGTSQEGLDVEWRCINVVAADRNLIERCELFDEADLDEALKRFEKLSAPTHLDNAASRVAKRFLTAFAERDWDAMVELLAADLHNEDRRRVVNGGIRRGRDSMMEDMRAAADVGVGCLESIDIATRGDRLVLARAETRYSATSEAFYVDNLVIGELDADGRTAAQVIFDPEDVDAAFAELDARYMAGEAAAHAHIWSLVTQTYAAFNRHELSKTTPDWVNIDHRLGVGSAPGDMNSYVSAFWTLVPDVSTRIEAVHRLSSLGAVFTHAESGTSHKGFDAEWREVALLTFDGDAINRCELFDETDLDAAIARFDELDRREQGLANAASRSAGLLMEHYKARDWGALAELLATDTLFDDHRRVVNSGCRRGRDVAVAQLRLTSDAGTENSSSACMATRGERLAVGRFAYSSVDTHRESFFSEYLAVVETDSDNRIVARIVFDLDDFDAAFAELESRYLAGEAAPYENTWAVLVLNLRAINRHELPAWTPDVVNIDHRRVTSFAPGELPAFLRARWETTPDVKFSIEAVHRLSHRGAVLTHVSFGSSSGGFQSEWRGITIAMIDGGRVCHSEHFDESDLAAALARFDELNRPTRKLENAASRVFGEFQRRFAAREWDAVADLLTDEACNDDRRAVVGAGTIRGSADAIEDLQGVAAQFANMSMTSDVVATRGERLALCRWHFSGFSNQSDALDWEFLGVVEIDADERITAIVTLGADDINGAIAELTTRWIASGEVAHPEVIEAVRPFAEAANRHDWDALAAGHVGATYVNHRQLASGAGTAVEDMSSLRMLASLIPDMSFEVAEVLAYSATGILTSVVVKGTSADGLTVEIPWITIMFFDRARVIRAETFDADQLDMALARFDELNAG